jgi:hypothetical protein
VCSLAAWRRSWSISPPKSFQSARIYPARRIASTNLGAVIKDAWAYFKDEPLVPIEEWEIPANSNLATHR